MPLGALSLWLGLRTRRDNDKYGNPLHQAAMLTPWRLFLSTIAQNPHLSQHKDIEMYYNV
jgi:hypothetical protein